MCWQAMISRRAWEVIGASLPVATTQFTQAKAPKHQRYSNRTKAINIQ